jgi:hypothetical protein
MGACLGLQLTQLLVARVPRGSSGSGDVGDLLPERCNGLRVRTRRLLALAGHHCEWRRSDPAPPTAPSRALLRPPPPRGPSAPRPPAVRPPHDCRTSCAARAARARSAASTRSWAARIEAAWRGQLWMVAGTRRHGVQRTCMALAARASSRNASAALRAARSSCRARSSSSPSPRADVAASRASASASCCSSTTMRACGQRCGRGHLQGAGCGA